MIEFYNYKDEKESAYVEFPGRIKDGNWFKSEKYYIDTDTKQRTDNPNFLKQDGKDIENEKMMCKRQECYKNLEDPIMMIKKTFMKLKEQNIDIGEGQKLIDNIDSIDNNYPMVS
jgi:hypothetical protein